MYGEQLERNMAELTARLYELYGTRWDFYRILSQLVSMMKKAAAGRPAYLRQQDEEASGLYGTESLSCPWYLSQETVGMMLYVDLFAGTLRALEDKIPYLQELGVNYVHLMPLFDCPAGENDGGYAISSYRRVQPRLGTIDDLRHVAEVFHKHGIRLVLDFVFNHTLITRNKLVFEMFLSYWYGPESGLYMPSVAVFLDKDFYACGTGPQRMEPANFADFIKGYDTGERLVFKEVFGQKGKQVRIAQVDGGKLRVDGELLTPDEFAAQMAGDNLTWLVQEYIFQHQVMSDFNPTSVNTLRIVTYHTGERCFVEDAAVRMGYPGELVDNAFSDGFYTNIDDTGKLDESLFNFSMKTRRIHEWQDVRIPAAKEAFQFCVDLHSRTPELFSVGWDIAIEQDGTPLVIEANDSWAVFVTQTAQGHAARPAWERYLAERRAFEAAIQRV